MKTLGLLGGMSWQSTVLYYEQINQGISDQLGQLHSAKIILHSVDFAEIEKLQHAGDWDSCAQILIEAAKGLQLAGAGIIMICTNTMHKVADEVEQQLEIPLLHIADATGEKLVEDDIKKVALIGTAFTMEQDFYKKRLTDQYALEVIIPEKADRELVHQVIYKELCLGKIESNSREQYTRIINKLKQQGAEAVILGCTEITLLISQNDSCLPVYDTTAIHAQKAVEVALS